MPAVKKRKLDEPKRQSKDEAKGTKPTAKHDDSDDFGGFSEDDGDAASKQPEAEAQPSNEPKAPTKSFQELGVIEQLCEACEALHYKAPTPIQEEAIPLALQGKDVIGLAETGSGKTAAFALPILQALLERPQPLFGLVLAPTRELAFQISQAFEALGSVIAVRCAVVVGGVDMTSQQIALAKRPHIVVATPGRLLDHLENTKGFSLRNLRYLVMDEADRLLDLDFGPILDKILKILPRENRHTYLFSATMSSKVEQLQRASLRNPAKVSVSSSSHQTVATLLQYYKFFPLKDKDMHLVHLLNDLAGQSTIVFARTVNETQRVALLLRALGFGAVPIHGQLSQSARLSALNKYRSGSRNVLVATDVAARGLDIPLVDIVVNFDLPGDSKTYVHRVGRTARAGKAGRAVSFVTQYDVEIWQRIEAALGRQLPEYPTDDDEVALLGERVSEAQRAAIKEMKSLHEKRGTRGSVLKLRKTKKGVKRRNDDMDREEA